MLDCSELTDEKMADLLRAIKGEVFKRKGNKKQTGLRKLELGGVLEDLNSAIAILGDADAELVCAKCRESITSMRGVVTADDGALFHGRCWDK